MALRGIGNAGRLANIINNSRTICCVCHSRGTQHIEKGIMKNETVHNRSGFQYCKECALLLAQDKELNVFWCDECNKSSVCTKPTVYANCPCRGEITSLSTTI